ncbi:MAG TPA: hypothetical protein VFZ34_26520, partial [Blastocatellia bacterium]|nr:hypothetical protein [Blastocatellia bacterium]
MKSKQTRFSVVELVSFPVWHKLDLSRNFSCVLLVCALAAANVFAQGPSGRYYVTDESGLNKVWQ